MTDLSDGLVQWALGVHVTQRSANVGPDRTCRVLIALALHADAEGVAWPSAQTLAGMISGVQRRDVRNALALLEKAGLIERIVDAPRNRRSLTWRILAPRDVLWRARGPVPAHVAGEPATSAASSLNAAPRPMAGYPAMGNHAPQAGPLAGAVAGNVAGHPAPNGKELNLSDREGESSSRRSRHCRVHAHWNHDSPCRACKRDRQGAEGAVTSGGRTPALHELSSAERAIVDDAVRGFLRGELPTHLIHAAEEARIAREMAFEAATDSL